MINSPLAQDQLEQCIKIIHAAIMNIEADNEDDNVDDIESSIESLEQATALIKSVVRDLRE